MRNISFMLTKAQILDRSKTVTRRLGWLNLYPGDRLQGVEKSMGLKKGEAIKKLAVIEVVSRCREPLEAMDCLGYGTIEVGKEGFPKLSGKQFVKMFCEHMKCTPKTVITRIEFKYVD